MKMTVAHVEMYNKWSDQKLKFEQSQSIAVIKYLIENPKGGIDNSLDQAVDACKRYTEIIAMRQANYDQQASLAQLDLFTD